MSQIRQHDPELTSDALATEIAALETLDLYGLRVKWRKLMRGPAPNHLNRSLLTRIVAYRMQARIYGDIDVKTARALEKILRDHERLKKSGSNKQKAVPVVAVMPRDQSHGPGTQFIREYAGEMHRVTVTREGFEWQGESYPSLSDIARRITGTSWNGPRFFGLREKTQKATA